MSFQGRPTSNSDMTITISYEYFNKIQAFVRRYAYHDRECGIHRDNMSSMNDFCDCGYNDGIKELTELLKKQKTN